MENALNIAIRYKPTQAEIEARMAYTGYDFLKARQDLINRALAAEVMKREHRSALHLCGDAWTWTADEVEIEQMKEAA